MDLDKEYFYNEFMESSSLDEKEEYEDKTTTSKAILADMVHAEDHILNYKGSIKGH